MLTTRPAADWARELNALGVPTGEVMTVPQVLATEQIEGRRLVGTLENDGAPLQVLGFTRCMAQHTVRIIVVSLVFR